MNKETLTVEQDGNTWICKGEGFIDLQASTNYAFGDTKAESIKNYAELISKLAL